MSPDYEDQFDQPKKTKKHWEKRKKKDDAQADASVWVRERSQIGGTPVGTVTSLALPIIQVMQGEAFYEMRLDPALSTHWAKELVIGDQVFFRRSEQEWFILGRLSRISLIARMRGDRTRSVLDRHVLAANVDIGVIVASLANPAFHPRFIDRYLAVLQDGNVSPLICLTKADLTEERHPILESYRRLGIPLIETSKQDAQGLEGLISQLRGKTSVLVGQSGVGKSTLVNLIAPQVQAETGEVTVKRGTGMHTTTKSSLYVWGKDSFIIDTPGIRSLGVEDIPKDELRFLFPEFSALPSACKFTDCLHLAEPGCAVKKALETPTGPIHPDRYESYCRMMGE